MVCSRSYFYITNMGNRIGFWTVHSSFQPWWIKINWQRTFLYYRLLHLILLAFNAFSVWSLSVISGDCQSVFAKKENTNAVVLVASQVHCAEYSWDYFDLLPRRDITLYDKLENKQTMRKTKLFLLITHLRKIIWAPFALNWWFRLDISFTLLQKTLPVLVAVVEELGGAFGESGLLVLPCVAAHLTQVSSLHSCSHFPFSINLIVFNIEPLHIDYHGLVPS